jgi:hypothetical protein
MLAGILMDAVLSEDTEGSGESARDAVRRVARDRGERIGAAERQRARPGRLGAERALSLAGKLLAEQGFEPDRESPGRLRLRNCPFHPLTATAPDLVCGLNHAFISGMMDGLEASGVDAVLDPRAGECCVELRAGGAAPAETAANHPTGALKIILRRNHYRRKIMPRPTRQRSPGEARHDANDCRKHGCGRRVRGTRRIGRRGPGHPIT